MIRIVTSVSLFACFLFSTVQAQSIVGSWVVKSAGEAESSVVLSFLANGTYVMVEDGDSIADPSGQDGMERGTYTWDSVTKQFTRKTLVDTSRQWGLSHSKFSKALVSGNILTLIAGTEKVNFSRVVSTTNPLVGGWFVSTGGGSFAVVTFLSSEGYFYARDGVSSAGGRTGMERGKYKWNPTTKSFTRTIRVDTNGKWGFSNAAKRTVSVSGSRLTLLTNGTQKTVFRRIASN